MELMILVGIVVPLVVIAYLFEWLGNRICNKSLAETNQRLEELTRLLEERLPVPPEENK